MQRYLVINPFGIGDVLFTTPVIKNIKEAYPDSTLGYWCNERVAPILKNNPDIDKIFVLSRGDFKKLFKKHKWKGIKKFLGLVYDIKKGQFDICLDFSLDHRYSLITKILGIKKRVGFNYKNRGRFLSDTLELEGYNSKHIVEYYLDLLKFLNIEPKYKELNLFILEEAKSRAGKLWADSGIGSKDLVIGIAPAGGASWGRDAYLKHWPKEKFAQLADKVIDSFGAKVIILGDESERHICAAIIKTMRNQAIDLAGNTNLEDLVALIDNLHLLITNDGGPLHIAVALEKKTVSFFGPVDYKVYGPYPLCRGKHIILTKTLECSPCYRNFRLSGCSRDKECLSGVTVEEAFAAVANLLKENKES